MKNLLVAAMLVASVAASADQTISADRLTRIDRLFQQYVDQARIGGAVALVLQDGKPVYERAFGWSDKEAGRKMTTDTIFRIASQTKALTSVAILSLMEEGKIGLNDPAGRVAGHSMLAAWCVIAPSSATASSPCMINSVVVRSASS